MGRVSGSGIEIGEEILISRDVEVKDTPPGFSDESGHEEGCTEVRRSGRQIKHQGPKCYRDPITHSVNLICSEADITDLNKAALALYRIKLATFKTRTDEPVKTRYGLLKRYLFRRKFGCASLDITKTWNVAWQIPLSSNLLRKREST